MVLNRVDFVKGKVKEKSEGELINTDKYFEFKFETPSQRGFLLDWA